LFHKKKKKRTLSVSVERKLFPLGVILSVWAEPTEGDSFPWDVPFLFLTSRHLVFVGVNPFLLTVMSHPIILKHHSVTVPERFLVSKMILLPLLMVMLSHGFHPMFMMLSVWFIEPLSLAR
jgi:hypothetical protein